MLLGLCEEASHVRLHFEQSKTNSVPNVKTVSGLHFNSHWVRKCRFAKVSIVGAFLLSSENAS